MLKLNAILFSLSLMPVLIISAFSKIEKSLRKKQLSHVKIQSKPSSKHKHPSIYSLIIYFTNPPMTYLYIQSVGHLNI